MKNTESQALQPSFVWMPQSDRYATILEFLVDRFPKISEDTWSSRLVAGKVLTEAGEILERESLYRSNCRISYYREVKAEREIPFAEAILFENEHILVVDKPHFLPVHPAGQYIRECLSHRLKLRTKNLQLTPVHRIDRLTAGLLLFCKNEKHRGAYQQMFSEGVVDKTYEAWGGLPLMKGDEWNIDNRLVAGEPWFRMAVQDGQLNSHSHIKLLHQKDCSALYELKPLTGKKHQLRVHMCEVAGGIMHDPFYPHLQDESEDDYSKPLQLLAKELTFIDPLSKDKMSFESTLTLQGY